MPKMASCGETVVAIGAALVRVGELSVRVGVVLGFTVGIGVGVWEGINVAVATIKGEGVEDGLLTAVA